MPSDVIERIRRFNRFYTNLIGVLNRHLPETSMSLSEARVLYELHDRQECTAREIMQFLDMDEGYLSRILRGFIRHGYIRKMRSVRDRRAFILSLTPRGRAQFQKINAASARAISRLLSDISPAEAEAVAGMMENIQRLLSNSHGHAKY